MEVLRSVSVAVAIAAICVFVCACNGPIYDSARQTFPDAMTPRSRWVATGDLEGPSKAIDGSIATVAVAPLGRTNAWIVIDLGKTCMLNMVVIDHGADEFGYCRELAVHTSDDASRWTPQVVVPGLRRMTNCLFTSPVLARYVRLQCLTPGASPWSVAEVYIN